MEEIFGPLLHGVRNVEVSHMYVRTVPEVVCSSTKRNLFVTAAVLSAILPPATPKLHIIYNLSLLFENLPCLEIEESPKAEYQSSEDALMECLSRPQSANVNNMSYTYIKSSKPKNVTANMHSYVVPSQKYISTIIIYYLVFYNSKFYSLINYILNS